MTPEEIKEYLTSEAGTTLIREITEPLVKKNKELLNELKKARKNKAPEDLEDLKRKASERDELEQKDLIRKGEYETALASLKERYTGEVATKDETIATLQKELHGIKIDTALKSALLSVGVIPETISVVQAFLATNVSMLDGKPVVGDQSIPEYVKDWAKTDQAKYFIQAKGKGGGAQGSGNGEVDPWEEYFKPESRNVTKQIELKLTDKTRYDALKSKYGAN